MEDEEGYTLLELMLVITLFAVFSAMVIPVTRSMHQYHMPEDELLRQWLLHQRVNAVLSSIPERICIRHSSLVAESWREGRWQAGTQPFIPGGGSYLVADKVEEISDDNLPCYLVRATHFYPSGGFSLVHGRKQYRYAWGENEESP